MIADKLGITIHIEDGLDLEKMAVSGQCFRWIRIGHLHYAIPHREHLLEIRQIGQAHVTAARVRPKYVGGESNPTSIPYFVYVLLFLAWGALMYALWKWVDRH